MAHSGPGAHLGDSFFFIWAFRRAMVLMTVLVIMKKKMMKIKMKKIKKRKL